MEDILTTILKDSFSLTQFKTRVRLLKANLLKTFFGGENISATPSSYDLSWLKTLPQSFYQKFTKDNVYQIFESLEAEMVKLPVLTIFLAFEPDEATLCQLGTFTRKMFDPTLLLETKLDPSLIAGAAFSWKGVLRDYSLRAKIESKKVEILEGFKKFLR